MFITVVSNLIFPNIDLIWFVISVIQLLLYNPLARIWWDFLLFDVAEPGLQGSATSNNKKTHQRLKYMSIYGTNVYLHEVSLYIYIYVNQITE